MGDCRSGNHTYSRSLSTTRYKHILPARLNSPHSLNQTSKRTNITHIEHFLTRYNLIMPDYVMLRFRK